MKAARKAVNGKLPQNAKNNLVPTPGSPMLEPSKGYTLPFTSKVGNVGGTVGSERALRSARTADGLIKERKPTITLLCTGCIQKPNRKDRLTATGCIRVCNKFPDEFLPVFPEQVEIF
ncbi:hypothetical protein PoB_002836200 [Plakobranchus ocellatus]|uniref:Uncharacterized protein n=1 Tax=Plakobranchus ocellatus TaxID=259542 RepID=A0AAV4A4T1_9GAST|nr:hypothetical protein PoB_002836200 [Plakobranchus ocellatus]